MNAVWFTINVGRSKNADPKWLIPLICRRGHVTKSDIGQIRILERETRFEIAPEAEARFREAVARSPEGNVQIEPAGAPAPRSEGGRKGPPPRSAPRRKRANG